MEAVALVNDDVGNGEVMASRHAQAGGVCVLLLLFSFPAFRFSSLPCTRIAIARGGGSCPTVASLSGPSSVSAGGGKELAKVFGEQSQHDDRDTRPFFCKLLLIFFFLCLCSVSAGRWRLFWSFVCSFLVFLLLNHKQKRELIAAGEERAHEGILLRRERASVPFSS